MKTQNFMQASICVATLVWLSCSVPSVATAQHFDQRLGQQTVVDSSITEVEVVIGSSQRLRFPYKIPELLVENPDIVKATPVSPTEILISGLKPGLTNIAVSDPDQNVQTIKVHVAADTRKLEAALIRHFPDSKIKVHALQTGVILKGSVARAEDMNTVMTIAQDYFPTTVINQLQVDGSQLVAIKVKVYEVNRTKLRTLGVDWAFFGTDVGFVSSVSDLIQSFSISPGNVESAGSNIAFGVIGSDTQFSKFIEALEQQNVAKLMDQPVLVAQNGRPAEFLSGGEIPISISSGLGTNSIEFRPFGTKLDIVPLIHGQGELTLEVRCEESEVDNALSTGAGVPGFRVRRVNTGVRMKAGHTLALAGDYQENLEHEKRGIPFLMDSPLFGSMFRRVEDTKIENELVFMITPRFISEVDPSQVPALGPGQLATEPSNHEFYFRGYNEVSRCNGDCPTNDLFNASNAQAGQHTGSIVPQHGGHQYIEQSGESVGSGTRSGSGTRQPKVNPTSYPLHGNAQPANSNVLPATPRIPVQNGSRVPVQNESLGGFGWPQGN